MSSWCTIESDPGVFTELIESIGVKGVQVEELCTLESEELARLKPIYGLIFLFKWVKETDERPTVAAADIEPGLFFAHQVINNACATQAILSVLLNSSAELGTTLGEFKSFTGDFTPDLKGLAISNSEEIRKTHNGFSRQEPFINEEVKATEKDDVFHFVAYVPYGGSVYELDGLKAGPIKLGDAAPGDEAAWLDVARGAVQARIERYAGSEIKFNLLAICKNRKLVAEEAIAAEEAKGAACNEGAVAELRADIASEEAKFANWRDENVRRKHNYIPLAVELLKVLAEQKKLPAMVEKAEVKRQELMAKAASRKA